MLTSFKVILLITGLLMMLESSIAVAQSDSSNLCGSSMAENRGIIFLRGIPENLPVGSVVSHIEFNGNDQQIDTRMFSPEEFLRYDSLSRNLTVIKPIVLPRTGQSITVVLECSVKSPGGSQWSKLDVVIGLVDSNDHAPAFTKDVYYADLKEISPNGTSVIRVSATDDDPTNRYISYSIMDGPYADHFEFPTPSIGQLTLMDPVDYEETKTINLTIMATDHPLEGDQPTLNATATVVITIEDGDDQNPVFYHPDECLGYVEESSPTGTEVKIDPSLEAYDPDFGISSPVRYSLIRDPVEEDHEFFDIDPISANVTLKNSALRRGRKFSLIVQATQEDNPNRYSRSLLRIYVQPANENKPFFEKSMYNATLVENTPIGTTVTTVAAVDNDEGTILVYDFVEPQTLFSIHQRSGVITTKARLSDDFKERYDLQVSVSDGTNMDYTLVIVTVLRINTNNPVFAQKSYYFSVSSKSSDIIGTVKATDADAGSSVRYSLQDPSGIFVIDPENGGIAINGDHDSIDQTEYTFFAVATDNDAPPRMVTVPVTVSFTDITPVARIDDTKTETNIIVIIIMAVLLGCLLLIVIVLLIYIYRSNNSQPNQTGTFVKSRSFQHGLDLNTGKDIHYAQVADPAEGLAYKSTRHSMFLYSDVQIDGDSTTTQENPFHSSDERGTHSSIYYSYDLHPELASSSSTRPGYPSSGSKHGYSEDSDGADPLYAKIVKPTSPQAMHEVNEIALAYDTAISPMDGASERTSSVSTINGSVPTFPTDHMGTFRGGLSGSTQRLVTPKGSVSRKGGLGSQGFDNAAMMSAQREKPDITVYY